MLVIIEANAYIGPGAGMGFIASALAMVGAISLAMLAFIYYPIKRHLKKRKARSEDSQIERPDQAKESEASKLDDD